MRDYSRDRINSMDRYTANNRNRYRETSNERYRGGDQRNYNRFSSLYPRSNDRSRDRSRDLRLAYPDMDKGFNCERDYDPQKCKTCRKCNKLGNPNHHEFLCKSFIRFNVNICKKCANGFHFERECKSGSTTSYSTDESDNVEANNSSETDRLDQIIKLLKLKNGAGLD